MEGKNFQEDVWMNDIQEYFVCDGCNNKGFTLVYSFSLRFHGVNFSDDLIYDKTVDEIYQCTTCQKTFTKRQIQAGLAAIKRKRKEN